MRRRRFPRAHTRQQRAPCTNGKHRRSWSGKDAKITEKLRKTFTTYCKQRYLCTLTSWRSQIRVLLRPPVFKKSGRVRPDFFSPRQARNAARRTRRGRLPRRNEMKPGDPAAPASSALFRARMGGPSHPPNLNSHFKIAQNRGVGRFGHEAPEVLISVPPQTVVGIDYPQRPRRRIHRGSATLPCRSRGAILCDRLKILPGGGILTPTAEIPRNGRLS